jgi:glycine C-acetyltransferase/8-amino-7-oxononanoate synthase
MFDQQMDKWAAQHLTRRLMPLASGTGPTVEIAGREVLLLASNDYLGLARHPRVVQASIEATQRYGAGAGAARLVSGTLPPHQAMEQALARFKNTQAVLTFSSGYLANLGAIPALIGQSGLILADRLCHASLLDGCRLSGADLRVYRHGDVELVKRLLTKRRVGRRTLIVTDGVFSMDGDVAPLPALSALAHEYDADLYVDDAHGAGVMGLHGRGTIEHFNLESQIPFQMGTLGKAFGSSGAYLAGSASLIEYLINSSRSFMFTTAPSPASAAAVTAAIDIVQREPERRARLWANRERLFTGLQRLGFTLSPSVSPIMPILIGKADTALAFAERLLSDGLYAPAIRPPTVPEETSRIRVTITSEHTVDQIDHALALFERAGRSAQII